jgi:hypothetical protein
MGNTCCSSMGDSAGNFISSTYCESGFNSTYFNLGINLKGNTSCCSFGEPECDCIASTSSPGLVIIELLNIKHASTQRAPSPAVQWLTLQVTSSLPLIVSQALTPGATHPSVNLKEPDCNFISSPLESPAWQVTLSLPRIH